MSASEDGGTGEGAVAAVAANDYLDAVAGSAKDLAVLAICVFAL